MNEYERLKLQFDAILKKEKKVIQREAFLAGWRAREHTKTRVPYDGNIVIPDAFQKWLDYAKEKL